MNDFRIDSFEKVFAASLDEIEEIDGKKVSISSKSTVEWMDEESFFFRLLLDNFRMH